MNHPILLVSQLSFSATAPALLYLLHPKGTSFGRIHAVMRCRFSDIINDMRLHLRLESELISCALWDNT